MLKTENEKAEKKGAIVNERDWRAGGVDGVDDVYRLFRRDGVSCRVPVSFSHLRSRHREIKTPRHFVLVGIHAVFFPAPYHFWVDSGQ